MTGERPVHQEVKVAFGSKEEASQLADVQLAGPLMERWLKAGRGEVAAYAESRVYRKERNKHEVRRISQVLDALNAGDVETALEMLSRNMAGILMADQYDSPGMLEEIEVLPPMRIMPRLFQRALIKDTERSARFKKGAGDK